MKWVLRILVAIVSVFVFLAALSLQQCSMATTEDQIIGIIIMIIATSVIFMAIEPHRLIPRAAKYIWAAKHRRIGFGITVVAIIAVVTLVVMWAQHRETYNILHYDGITWNEMSSGTTNQLYSVWGSSPSDVFVVGDWGAILHYDGTAWRKMSNGTVFQHFGIWGSSPSDVFAVGVLR